MSRSPVIAQAAEQILAVSPDAVVTYRLLRDVLERPVDDAELQTARSALWGHPHVRRLQREQREDGSWGNLHCGSPTDQHTISHTEGGVDLALGLGLDTSHPILQNAQAHLADLLDGRRSFRDFEKNDRFPAGWRMFAAAKLASIERYHPATDRVFANFREILLRTFSSGAYDAEAAERAHEELHGIHSGVGYLGLASQYPVELLGSRTEQIPAAVEALYVRWLWSRDHLGYLLGRPAQPPIGQTPLWVDLWFRTHELLSAYPTWRALSGEVIDWLWNQRNPVGLWDFGSLNGVWAQLRLPQDRRRRSVREQYWSLRVLALLKKHEDMV